MTPLLIALLVFLLIGLGLTLALRRPSAQVASPARDHTQLAQLRWSEFVRLVLQAMRARGYRTLAEPGLPGDGIPGEGGDILLARDQERVLLSCKYAQAKALGADAVMGLSSAAALRGATEVVLVTPGHFDDEAIRLARQQRIELIDGEDLWPEVRPYVALPSYGNATSVPSPAATPRLALAWGAAALAGGLAWFALQALQGPPEPAPEAVAVAVAPSPPPATAPAVAPAPTTSPAATDPSDDTAPASTDDPAELARRRAVVADTVSSLAGVERALWTSQSTLVVHLAGDNLDPGEALCRVVRRYPELAASRLQLQPPAGSSQLVRYRQCQAY